MTDITIPPEAVEAAARVLHSHAEIFDDLLWEDISQADQEAYFEEARASIAAALNAWPGMQHKPYWDFRTHEKHTELILPVPQKEKGGQ